MKKKKYVAPEISVIGMEPLQIMTGSIESDHGSAPDGDKNNGFLGWTPDGDENNGFSVQEEEENGEYEF